jgi:short-subunit dehydrogenase
MPLTPLEEEDDASVTRQLEINLHAVIHGTREAMRRMRPRDSGHIVNIASMAGKTGYANMATYCATKHGVVGLSEAARLELRGTGIEVSLVMPGVVRTELATGLRTPRGVKVVTPEAVAEAVVGALKVPRFDVFIPRTGGVIIQLGGALPRRVRDAIVRAMHADEVATDVDRAARAAYEARAAHSAPHVDHIAEIEDDEREANAA